MDDLKAKPVAQEPPGACGFPGVAHPVRYARVHGVL
jgi:hypothetical protein